MSIEAAELLVFKHKPIPSVGLQDPIQQEDGGKEEVEVANRNVVVEEDYKRDYILAEKSVSIEPENVENGVEEVVNALDESLMEEEEYTVKE